MALDQEQSRQLLKITETYQHEMVSIRAEINDFDNVKASLHDKYKE